MELPVWFSLWFPDSARVGVDELQRPDDDGIRAGVIDAVEELLCTETDVWLVEGGDDDADGDDPAAADDDVCVTAGYREGVGRERRRHLQQSGLPSIVRRSPAVTVRGRSRDGLEWTVWTLSYAVDQIGAVYVQEALQNQPQVRFDALQDAALEALQEVVQLAANVNIMEGRFDAMLSTRLVTTTTTGTVRASRVNEEVDTFTAASLRGTDGGGGGGGGAEESQRDEFVPRTWYPMRVAGICLLVASLLGFSLLTHLAHRRRRGILVRAAAAAGGEEGEEASLALHDAEAVEKLLHRSAHFQSAAAAAATAGPAVTQTAAAVLREPSVPAGLGRVALEILREEEQGQQGEPGGSGRSRSGQQSPLIAAPHDKPSLGGIMDGCEPPYARPQQDDDEEESILDMLQLHVTQGIQGMCPQ
jgi:hypothetical protein